MSKTIFSSAKHSVSQDIPFETQPIVTFNIISIYDAYK